MALPPVSVAWNYSANNRVAWVDALTTTSECALLIKNRLKAAGYTVKGSCDGVNGGMDNVDRWGTAANVQTTSTSTTAPVSWIVLRDGNNNDILLSGLLGDGAPGRYDTYTFAVSLLGDIAPNGTDARYQPVSGNLQQLSNYYVQYSSHSLIGLDHTTNQQIPYDRLVTIYTRPAAKGFRVLMFAGGSARVCWGVDECEAADYAPGVAVSANHAFYAPNLNALNVAQNGIVTSGFNNYDRMWLVVANVGTTEVTCARTLEGIGYSPEGSSVDLQIMGTSPAYRPPLLQGTGYMMRRIGLYSITAGFTGRVGLLQDWWQGRTGFGNTPPGVSDGDVYGANEFVVVSGIAGLVWPWNGTGVAVS